MLKLLNDIQSMAFTRYTWIAMYFTEIDWTCISGLF